MQADQVQLRKRLQNLLLDFIYKQICLKKTNEEIIKELERRHMPPMSHDGIREIRQILLEKEQKHPVKMMEFRQRLKVQ